MLPMILILICNISIIIKTIKNEKIRMKLQNKKKLKKKNLTANKFPSQTTLNIGRQKTIKTRPFYLADTQLIIKNTKLPKNSAKKLTIILLIISFSFFVLNLPYLLFWVICFYESAYTFMNFSGKNYSYGVLYVTEMIYLINYSIKFYIYCSSSNLYQNQLKSTCKLLF